MRDVHIEQVDNLAPRGSIGGGRQTGGSDFHGAFGAAQILHRSAQEDRAIVCADFHGLPWQFRPQLAAHRIQPVVERGHVGAYRYIKELTAAMSVPDDQACLAGSPPLHHHFGRTRRMNICDLCQIISNALDRPRNVNKNRLAHGDRQIVRRVLNRGGWRVEKETGRFEPEGPRQRRELKTMR